MRMMFFGVTALRGSGGSGCRRQRLRMATATARLAASWPTMYRSSSCTICRGVRSATVGLPRGCIGCMGPIVPMDHSQFLDLNIRIRKDTQVRGDLQGGADDLGRGQVRMGHESAGDGEGVAAAGT